MGNLPNINSENFYTWSYFEAARSPRKRSILGVCEHCEDEADAERAHTETKKVARLATSNPDILPKSCIKSEISRLAKLGKTQHTWRM